MRTHIVSPASGHSFHRTKPFTQPHWISMMMLRRSSDGDRRLLRREAFFARREEMIEEERVWAALGLQGPTFTGWSRSMVPPKGVTVW
jgi:hypothetical protein